VLGLSTAFAAPAQAATVGHGTAASCTSARVVAAVRAGGTIRFSCGSRPVTILMRATAKIINAHREIVLDGGGRVTLSGQGRRRILYLNTCDRALVFTTSHCQDQATPRLVVRGPAFANGNATGEEVDGGGGGAISARGGRLRIERSSFTGNRCDPQCPDVGGGAVRALSQYHGLPVVVSDSRIGNVCSNGGALSSIGVSWTVRRSEFTRNRANGRGATPARGGTPRGRQRRRDLQRRQPHPADALRGLPGIFFLGAGRPTITRSVLEGSPGQSSGVAAAGSP
jgi:hypothetical protein